MMTPVKQNNIVQDAVQKASAQWQTAFNSGDAAGCAAQYENNAVMHARPFGTFIGSTDIQGFWQQLIDDGYANVQYVDPKIKVIDEKSAIVTAAWTMNKAAGKIHKELWVLQSDGIALLREDDFEAQN